MDTDPSPTSVQVPNQRTTVFISYSHKDKRWLEKLRTTLQPIVPLDAIAIWDDTHIKAGDKWREEIDRALGSAKVAVLLVSPDFLASNFIAEFELPPLLQAAKREGLTILWIAVRPSVYRYTVIGEYQAVNDPKWPLYKLSGARREEELVKIGEQIMKAAAAARASELSGKAIPTGQAPSEPLGRADSETYSTPLPSNFPDALVNFEDQRHDFEKMLGHSAEKRLMFVRGPDGIGKTSLLRMVQFHCEQIGRPCCSINFQGQSYDSPHFNLARAMCNQLGVTPRYLAQALLPLSTFRPVEADATTSPEENTFNSQVVTEVLDAVSSTHPGLRERYIKDRLKRAFVTDLSRFAAEKGGITCLFDTFERISTEDEDWLYDALLWPVAQGQLKGINIVTAGHRWPKSEKLDWEKNAYLIDGLPRISLEHLKIYAQKLGVVLTDEDARFSWDLTGRGDPLLMGIAVRNLRAAREVRS